MLYVTIVTQISELVVIKPPPKITLDIFLHQLQGYPVTWELYSPHLIV